MPLNCGVGEDSWESLGQRGDQPVNLKGNQSWTLIGRTDAEAEAPVFWSPDGIDNSLEKSLMLGKMEDRKRRGHQRMKWLDGVTGAMDIHTNLANFKGQGGLVCCSPCSHRKSRHDCMTEQQQYSIVYIYHIFIHSSINKHLGYFLVLTVVNSAMNIGVNISFFSGPCLCLLKMQIPGLSLYLLSQNLRPGPGKVC